MRKMFLFVMALVSCFMVMGVQAKSLDAKSAYHGKALALNFQDVPIKTVLKIIADFAGKNMVVSDAVKGNISLRLQAMPWDEALDLILQGNGLTKRQQGTVIFIAPRQQFLREEAASLKARAQIHKLTPLHSVLIPIHYAKASDLAILLKDRKSSLLTKRGNVSVDARTNSLWLKDSKSQIKTVLHLIRKLDIPVKQVEIEARIVNMSKEGMLDLGIRFGVTKESHLSGSLRGANQMQLGKTPGQIPFTERLNLDLPAFVANPASVGVALAKLGKGVLLDGELSALESERKAQVVANPKLITTNQQPARIESGEEIPYQESTSSGATAVVFKKAVLRLKVTPQITPDNRLLLDLKINQDMPSGRMVNGVPAIVTKAIQTQALVNNGQTIVLGGIYKQDKDNTIRRIPFLGKLPIFGMLFSNLEQKVRNEELLIFITPRIIPQELNDRKHFHKPVVFVRTPLQRYQGKQIQKQTDI